MERNKRLANKIFFILANFESNLQKECLIHSKQKSITISY